MTERSRGIAVAGAHRTVRTLTDGEGPFAGGLVTRGEGVAVCVDAALLAGWAGWRFAGSEHVAAPEDLALRADGQDALLPWCVRSVESYLGLRSDEDPLANGEAVTLAVSVLRGLVELEALDDADDAPAGQWWLTDEGRPVFVIGAGDPPRAVSARLIDVLETGIEDRALRRVLSRLRAALDEPRRLRAEIARWEQELLEVAAPRALRTVDGEGQAALIRVGESQDRTRGVRRRELRALGPNATGGAGSDDSRHPGLRSWPRAGAALWRTARERVVERMPRRVGQRAEPPTGRRRWVGPAVVAAGAAAAVCVLGVVWPTGGGPPTAGAADRRSTPSASPWPGASAGTPGRSPAPTTTSPAAIPPKTATPGIAPTLGPSRSQDPTAAATELIAGVRRCRQTPAPACDVLWDGGRDAAIQIRGDGAAPVLIEDYGDIAAVRNPAQEGAQMIVIIRRDGEWRIRDVYDVADPPSGGAAAL
ncbi:hypothetical protein [Microbacterium panaciterrae]|uniref:Uncharacterized protein n=1 Tax=Microbacterium panaciterrae TaxID=985759 RepID=A0ABP8P9J7_9MICO